MGYRSEVYMHIVTTDDEIRAFEMNALLMVTNTDIGKHWNVFKNIDVEECEICTVSKNKIVFHVQDWKWYQDYDQVDAVEAIYKYFAILACDNDSIDCCFLRIGEDDEDTEYKYENEGSELAGISRVLEIYE